MISSVSNSQIKNIIHLKKTAKERNRQDLFLVEGIKMFLETPPERMEKAYLSGGFLRRYEKDEQVQDRLGRIRWEEVAEAPERAISDTRTPQGVVCLVRQFHYRPEELLDIPGRADDPDELSNQDKPEKSEKPDQQDKPEKSEKPDQQDKPEKLKNPEDRPALMADGADSGAEIKEESVCPLVMILENLQDPGNLGTILRSAEGTGVTGILLSDSCVDVYNPKVIRSTMGSVFRVPFCYTEDLEGILTAWREAGVRLFAAHLAGERSYDREDYRYPSGFLIGNESRGLTDRTAALADTLIRIPMLGKVESLNAAVASSLLMFEAARQRRQSQI